MQDNEEPSHVMSTYQVELVLHILSIWPGKGLVMLTPTHIVSEQRSGPSTYAATCTTSLLCPDLVLSRHSFLSFYFFLHLLDII